MRRQGAGWRPQSQAGRPGAAPPAPLRGPDSCVRRHTAHAGEGGLRRGHSPGRAGQGRAGRGVQGPAHCAGPGGWRARRASGGRWLQRRGPREGPEQESGPPPPTGARPPGPAPLQRRACKAGHALRRSAPVPQRGAAAAHRGQRSGALGPRAPAAPRTTPAPPALQGLRAQPWGLNKSLRLRRERTDKPTSRGPDASARRPAGSRAFVAAGGRKALRLLWPTRDPSPGGPLQPLTPPPLWTVPGSRMTAPHLCHRPAHPPPTARGCAPHQKALRENVPARAQAPATLWAGGGEAEAATPPPRTAAVPLHRTLCPSGQHCQKANQGRGSERAVRRTLPADAARSLGQRPRDAGSSAESPPWGLRPLPGVEELGTTQHSHLLPQGRPGAPPAAPTAHWAGAHSPAPRAGRTAATTQEGGTPSPPPCTWWGARGGCPPAGGQPAHSQPRTGVAAPYTVSHERQRGQSWEILALALGPGSETDGFCMCTGHRGEERGNPMTLGPRPDLGTKSPLPRMPWCGVPNITLCKGVSPLLLHRQLGKGSGLLHPPHAGASPTAAPRGARARQFRDGSPAGRPGPSA